MRLPGKPYHEGEPRTRTLAGRLRFSGMFNVENQREIKNDKETRKRTCYSVENCAYAVPREPHGVQYRQNLTIPT